ncbi:MAG TPA: response regulator [Edaphobacter sp.]|uniref:response regulator n=1 Tax=Edaphobacter sp. TaxID=1934404 RepID=UPI002C9B1923|nr:response regulator [Edaphobacter sp.]HUZ96957.1 response regulator [Edaphobacter sp.]
MGTTALIVDDDPGMCELIQAILGSVDIAAEILTDSAKAAAYLQQKKFDAIFLDVNMPAPDGIELARQIRATGFNQKTLIIMITGEEDRGILARGFAAGANFFLFKPIDRQRVLRVVRASRCQIQDERRRFHRVSVSCKVLVESGGQKVEGCTVDVSISGLLVRSASVFAEGSPVDISLQLTSGKPPVRAKGRVARVIGEDRMGIQLENLGTSQSAQMQEFLLPLILQEIEP